MPTRKSIVCKTPVVRALLSGKLRQLHFPMRVQPAYLYGKTVLWHHIGGPKWQSGSPMSYECPYGQPGSTLRVKETWWQGNGPTWGEHCIVFEADGAHLWAPGSGFDEYDLKQFRKRSAAHLPLSHCRLKLSIGSVRAHRIQDLSEDDMRESGLGTLFGGGMFSRTFDSYWDEIHGSRSWDFNAWVWSLGFTAHNSLGERSC